MATSSSSSVVDLGEAADLNDDVTSLFFTNSNAAGPAVSWPPSSETPSTLTRQDTIAALCSKHGVPTELLTPACAQDQRACTPPPAGSNKLCVYAAALDAGLRFPLHDFYIKVLRHYQLAPSQLTPNSWSYLAAFVLLCQHAEVQPLVSVFRYFFTICAQTHEGKPTGFHHFQPYHDQSHDERRRRRLFTGTLPNRIGWKSRYFFLDCPSAWKCPVKWGKPRRENARKVQLTDTVTKKLMAMECVDIKVFLANREMPVGDLAALAPPQPAVKVEARAAAASAAAEYTSTTTRKRSRLSPSPAAVLSQSQPLPMSPPPGFARASSTGGSSVHAPPPSLAPIIAPSTGGSSVNIPLPGFHHIPPPQQQSLGESSSAPRDQVPGRRTGAQTVSNGGSSEVTPPAAHKMWSIDSLQLWEAMAKVGEQEAMITKLNQELNLVKTWNTQWKEELRAARAKHDTETAGLIAHLRAANDRNSQLFGHLQTANAEVARLQAASVEVAQLKAEHAAEIAHLKEEFAAKENRLKEELAYNAYNAEQLKNEGYYMGASHMMNHALTVYKVKGAISPEDLKFDLL